MKRINFMVILAFLIFGLAGPVSADILNLTDLPSQTAGGYYVGFSFGNLNGGQTFEMVCNDFSHITYIPSSHEVNVSTLPSLAYARFGNDAAALAKYQSAVWLIWQLYDNPGQAGDINFAIWNLFTPAAPDYGNSNTWLALAQAINPSDYDFSLARIFTPVLANLKDQEFIRAPVPEALSVVLLGLGLVGIATFRTFRRKLPAL